DGEPEQLMEQMGVNIIEVKADKLRELKEKLIQRDEVRSAAQLGIRLRILIHQYVEQPIEWLKQTFPELQNAEMNHARPSLEDVFVSVTGKGRQ
ncbi:TPA: ABC transporter ATP-binding protein, partial [Vibrio parahaemolyticus]|nr:ABC transporter ATP-binding protein [Vibrio parahaemolyticus]